MVPDSSLCIGDVGGRPVLVVEGAPDRVVAVERDRILDRHLLRSLAHVVGVLLERELGRVNADHHQPVLLVLLRPRPDVRERAEPVDAGVRPEVDEDDFPLEVRGRERLRIEPPGGAVERRQLAFDW
jgi:hypothetical protein